MFPTWNFRSIEEIVLEIREPQHITLGYKKNKATVCVATYLYDEEEDNTFEKYVAFFIPKYSFKDRSFGYVVRYSNVEFEKYKTYSYKYKIEGESFQMTGEVVVDDLSSEELKPIREYLNDLKHSEQVKASSVRLTSVKADIEQLTRIWHYDEDSSYRTSGLDFPYYERDIVYRMNIGGKFLHFVIDDESDDYFYYRSSLKELFSVTNTIQKH